MALFEIKLELNGLEQALDRIEEVENRLQSKCNELVNRLAEIGVRIANIHYSSAPYAGTKDVNVEIQPDGNGSVTIVASGTSVLFIEFGTGITNPYDAPEARAKLSDGGSSIDALGQFGEKRGSSEFGWFYPLENGLGSPAPSKTEVSFKNPDLIHTYGSNATPAMYRARKHMIENIEKVAREVFGL